MGVFLRDVMRANGENFRIMGPDETASNRLGAVFEATDRCGRTSASQATITSHPTAA